MYILLNRGATDSARAPNPDKTPNTAAAAFYFVSFFKAFVMTNLQYEMNNLVNKFFIKPQMTKNSQDDYLNHIHSLKHFYRKI